MSVCLIMCPTFTVTSSGYGSSESKNGFEMILIYFELVFGGSSRQIQIDRQTGRQIDRHILRQIDRQTDRQTDRYIQPPEGSFQIPVVDWFSESLTPSTVVGCRKGFCRRFPRWIAWCGGFLKQGYPKSSKSLDKFSIETTMVTWGTPILGNHQQSEGCPNTKPADITGEKPYSTNHLAVLIHPSHYDQSNYQTVLYGLY